MAAAIADYVADDFGLTRRRLRVLDAGTGDGRVLKGVIERLVETHRHRPCEMVLKEYDFHHIEALLQNIAPLLRRLPQLALFVTNRTFRQLGGFAEDLCKENTVCFDDIAGYRVVAMIGTASLLNQEDSLLHSFPRVEDIQRKQNGAEFPFMPLSDLWNAEQTIHDLDARTAPALKALGDEIRAREIYDELAAAGGRGKHFTVTIARQERGDVALPDSGEFFWDLAIVAHAFNRDKDPGWICRNILAPLCEGLSIGGVLVNVQAVEGGQVSELKREIFGDSFAFNSPSLALAEALQASLDSEQFQLLPSRKIHYQGNIGAGSFKCLEPWQRELVLQQFVVSVTYHLQIPEAAWVPQGAAIAAKIQELLERDGQLVYSLSIAGIRRRE
jgi:hypothetical protein